MKVVINRSQSDFQLSKAGAQALLDAGCTAIAIPRKKIFNNEDRSGPDGYQALRQAYLAGYDIGFLLSADLKYVLDVSKIERKNPYLVALVETMGIAAGADGTNLMVVDIPIAWANTVIEKDAVGEFVRPVGQRWPEV